MAQKYEYIATQKIEIEPGSGMVAFVEGQYVPAEVVENLGVQDKVRSATPTVSSLRHTPPPAST